MCSAVRKPAPEVSRDGPGRSGSTDGWTPAATPPRDGCPGALPAAERGFAAGRAEPCGDPQIHGGRPAWPSWPWLRVGHLPNQQEPATLWHHDHALGITRTNVYAGLAGFYLLRDPHLAAARYPPNAGPDTLRRRPRTPAAVAPPSADAAPGAPAKAPPRALPRQPPRVPRPRARYRDAATSRVAARNTRALEMHVFVDDRLGAGLACKGSDPAPGVVLLMARQRSPSRTHGQEDVR